MNVELLREAAEWRLLSLLFEYPADTEPRASASGNAWRERLAALLPNLSDPRFRETAEHALTEAEEGVYHSAFGPAGPVSPREAAYLQGVQLGYLMSDLEARYAAFGYHPRTPEASDHISVEAGFIAWLKLKQAYAIASADDEHAEITAEAVQSFIDDHLSNMAEPLAQRLEPLAPPYLVLASHLLYDRVGSPPQAAPTPLEQLLGDEGEVTCGDAPPQDALIQLEP